MGSGDNVIPAAWLLETWDRGQVAASAAARAIALLRLADPDADAALLPVGDVNTRLLRLRERLFGPQLTCVADCLECGERLEMGFSVGDLLTPTEAPPSELAVSAEGESFRFRLPTWMDLAAVAQSPLAHHPGELLLERCFLGSPGDADEVTTEAPIFTEAVMEAAAAELEAADPRAEMLIAIGCAGCGAQFEARFDVVEYLWAEVDARARRLLGE
ncbi:MAG: hypothetical protein ACO1SX_13025, partial [Actinomycetota bacterium]